jgi:hypothetical protein
MVLKKASSETEDFPAPEGVKTPQMVQALAVHHHLAAMGRAAVVKE